MQWFYESASEQIVSIKRQIFWFEKEKAMENFWIALELMGKGMLGIFTVIIIIMLIVMLLSKITK